MNCKALLLNLSLISLLLTFSNCHHNQNNTADTSSTTSTSGTSNAQTVPGINEKFEQGKKDAYTGGKVTFRTGDWYLVDALVGSSAQDVKNGSQSVRIRGNGKLAMLFDLNAASRVSVSYAAYGKDKASNWQLWVSTDGGLHYRQVGSTITAGSHAMKQATFQVNITGSVRFEVVKTSGGKNRINIDNFTVNNRQGDAGGTVTDTSTNTGTAQPVSGDNSNLLLGNPSNATSSTANADNYLIDHQYYTESYSRSRAEPNWVCWHIGADDLGSTDRMNNFRKDTHLPPGWYEVDSTSYRGSGFDKGHNCPSGDRTSSTAANSATFLMDNMIPQAPNNNQRTWEHLESYCRDEVKKGNEVYVIMGSYGSGGTGRNGYATTVDDGRVNVPAHIWKIAVIIPEGNNDLLRVSANTQVIAVNTPNDNSIQPNWMLYLCTVRDLEQATGYHLLSALPQAVQDAIETQKFKGGGTQRYYRADRWSR